MWIERKALSQELPALGGMETRALCEALASLGFPVDGVERREGTEVLDVDITANRGDVMSHRGVARELAAKLQADLNPMQQVQPLPTGPALAIALEAEACPIYATAVLVLGEGFTPPEIQTFLSALGSNPKRLPAVDASNELLHRFGHPTHAFDADQIRGAVTVRFARPGEALVTLDGVSRSLTPEDLVIADEAGPIALAGVMGGEATKVSEGTRRVLLESAWFDPKTVRAMARRHSLHTDASHRFGRGADPAMAESARNLLVARLQGWCGATLLACWTVGRVPAPAPAVPLSWALLERIAGEALPREASIVILEGLGCTVTEHQDGLQVVPPTWRHDLAIPEDLAEEVLRLRGYDRLPSALPPQDSAPQALAAAQLQRQRVARRLAHLGFHQTVTYGFTSPEADEAFAGPGNPAAGRTLANPLGREYSILRASLLPSLSAVAEQNLRQGARDIRLFEVAPTYQSGPQGPVETTTVGVVWGGTLGGEDYLSPARPVKAAHLRGLAQGLGLPGPDIRDLGDGLFGFEATLEAFPAQADRIIPGFRPYHRYPAVERDLSLLVGLDQRHDALVGAMQAALPGPVLQDLRCVDVFRHRSLPEGKQAWLLRFRFQADRTLTGEEVEGWVAQALAAAEAQGAQLRA